LETLWPLLGALGLVLLDISWFSQIVRIHRRKSADDVSVFFPLLNIVGRLLAVGYSMHSGADVFTWGFLVGVVVRGLFLGQVLYYRFGARQASAGLRDRLVLPAVLASSAADFSQIGRAK